MTTSKNDNPSMAQTEADRIANLTLGEIRRLTSMLDANADKQREFHGLQIVVLTQGFVYVAADVQTDNNWVYMKKAFNCRVWGTQQGLGELAAKSPAELPESKMDSCGDIRAPLNALVHLMTCNNDKWGAWYKSQEKAGVK